jgi:hypothetical protein
VGVAPAGESASEILQPEPVDLQRLAVEQRHLRDDREGHP